MWFDTAEVVRRALMLQRAFAAGDVRAIDARAAALVEAVVSHHRKPAVAPEWIARLRSVLDERFDRPIRFDVLARDFGLHPVYASRAFRRFVGVSMTEYVQDARLRDARRQLSSSARTIAGIAALSGFADASHLCRTFSSRFGVRPSEYRIMTRFSAFNAAPARRITFKE
jgi:AraC-like DNA-binding protein